jgi:hypothetical protein
MSTFTSTLGLAQGDLIVVKIRALNALGYSDYSEVNTVGSVVAVPPLQM